MVYESKENVNVDFGKKAPNSMKPFLYGILFNIESIIYTRFCIIPVNGQFEMTLLKELAE